MAGFDFIDVSMRGYRAVWENRVALLTVAVLPFFIKMGSFAAVMFLGLEMNFLRQGLVLLPSYFAEGFLVAYVIRMIISGGEIGDDPKNVERSLAQGGARDLTAATIVYVLIKLTLAFVSGMTLHNMGAEVLGAGVDGAAAVEQIAAPEQGAAVEQAAAAPEGSAMMSFLMLSSLVFVIWAFRLLWLYVPVALGIPVFKFLARIPDYAVSFRMMGAWLICFLPFGILMLMVYQVLGEALGHSVESPSAVFPLLLLPVQAAIELVIALVSSVTMAYAVQQIFEKDEAR